MANRGLMYGYDEANNKNVRLAAYSDGALGVSLNAGVTISTSGLATDSKQDDIISALTGVSGDLDSINTNVATASKQDDIISALTGVSGDLDSINTNIADTVPGVSGPTEWVTNLAVAKGTSIGSTGGFIDMNNYNNLTIFGKTTTQSSWKLVYYTGSSEFEELNSTTTQTSESSTSGTSYAFSQVWNNVGSDKLTLLNAGVEDESAATFYYTLVR